MKDWKGLREDQNLEWEPPWRMAEKEDSRWAALRRKDILLMASQFYVQHSFEHILSHLPLKTPINTIALINVLGICRFFFLRRSKRCSDLYFRLGPSENKRYRQGQLISRWCLALLLVKDDGLLDSIIAWWKSSIDHTVSLPLNPSSPKITYCPEVILPARKR